MQSIIKKFKLSRRGILLPETLKIILAVMAIVVLVFLASNLLTIFSDKAKFEQAKGTLDDIIAVEKVMKDGEEKTYLILSPFKGALVYDKDNKKICACADFDDKLTCVSGGYCKSIDKEILFYDKMDQVEYIYFKPAPREILITKSIGIIKISTI